SRVAAELIRRAERAEMLAAVHAAAREPLAFAAALFREQAKLATRLEATALTARIEVDAPKLHEAARELLSFVERSAPAGLREAANVASSSAIAAELVACARNSRAHATAGDYLARAILRPYLALLAEAGRPLLDAPFTRTEGRCPFCDGAP